jgi:hypothetical protein
MVVSQVDGIARYVGVGDVHVTKTLTTPQGTIIGSAGSTEMSKRNEDPVKYVMLVTFDGDKAPVCERIEIQTRGIITFPTITLPEHIGVFLDHVRKRIVTGERLPMVVASYDRSLHVEVQAAVKIIEGMGIDIVRMTSESAVVDEADLSGHVEAGSVLMADILREMFPEGSVERDLSLSLWDSPMTAEQTLESFVDQTKKKHATQESNTQQHLPAPPP